MPEPATTPTGFKRRAHPPSLRSLLALWLPGGLAALAVLLPVFYLLLRASQAGAEAWALLLRPATLQTLGRTVLLAGSVTLASMLLAVPLAWLTARTDLPGRRFWALTSALPLVIPSYVGAYLLVSTLGPRGMLQGWLEDWLGVTRLPEIYGFPGALFILTILSYPFILLSVRAALLRIDPALEEAARSLGLSAWQVFWRVVLPQLRPAIAAGGMLVALYVVRDFGAVAIMRYNTFTRVIYLQYSATFDRTAAAVLALALVALTLALLGVETWTRGRARYHASEASHPRPPAILPLGRWRWPAVLFCAAVAFAAVLMPALNLLYWLGRGLAAGEQVGALWLETRNSIIAAALAAGATLAAALPVAALSVRYRGRASRLIERLTYSAFALPGIVIALALVFFGANYARPFYQTLPLLTLAYVILFVPEAVGAIRTSLLQVHPSMEEAARGLGRSPLAVFRSITLPLVRPGVASGAALVFLTAMKELPATLILAPIGFKTLATGVWGAVSEAFFARAAAPALLIVLVSSVPMALLLLRDRPTGAPERPDPAPTSLG
ncbi:MAG: iron ABC transporter permease [Chloroflexi bacterium]|nr:iron ABC transporter permease [Chloroflexota bacterium]